uniref:Uncharacterized protein n=1 Tax=Salvator merianae TaxID=96440 RepID=A0A8D0EBE1_SALMN
MGKKGRVGKKTGFCSSSSFKLIQMQVPLQILGIIGSVRCYWRMTAGNMQTTACLV